jgi:hypothetical protein
VVFWLRVVLSARSRTKSSGLGCSKSVELFFLSE